MEINVDETFKLAKQTLKFYKKLVKAWNSKKGKYICKDPHEIIVPINGLVIQVGKRKFAQLKSNIEVSIMEQEQIDEIHDKIENIKAGKSEKYRYECEENDCIWVEIIG